MEGKLISNQEMKDTINRKMKKAGYLHCRLCGLIAGQKMTNSKTGEKTGVTLTKDEEGYLCQLCGSNQNGGN